jgi:hypothetical protein
MVWLWILLLGLVGGLIGGALMLAWDSRQKANEWRRIYGRRLGEKYTVDRSGFLQKRGVRP